MFRTKVFPCLLALLFHVSLASISHAQDGGEIIALSAVSPEGKPLPARTVSLDGKSAPLWQSADRSAALLFKCATSAGTSVPGGLAYLKITYLDRGYGRLTVRGKNAAGEWVKPDKLTSPVLLDSGRLVTSYARCPDLPLAAAEIKVSLEGTRDNPLAVESVAASAKPFEDAHFRWLLDEPWKRPYAGPTRPDPDNGTLKGKVLVGYQGWFRTPNDPYDNGWWHWGDFKRGVFHTDMWPDVSQYPPETLDKTADIKTSGGQPGRLFSSAWPEVARLHFDWMRGHGIDGALLQRFVSPRDLHSLGGGPEWVLGSVREAANREGRIWAVEYDVSGCPDDKLLEYIKTDWTWLVDQFGLRQDKNYAREGDKLVVAVWGMPFADRGISAKTANAVLDFLKHDSRYGGNYVIGGVPAWWQTLPPEWQAHIRHYDGAISWQSQNYAEDQEGFNRIGVDYYPQVWPGFSWANLKHLPAGSPEQHNPREGGLFYEHLLTKALNGGADRGFVGMYDEYDEGTAILPMTDDPPATPERPGVAAKFFANPVWEGRSQEAMLTQIDLPLDGAAPAKDTPGTNFTARFAGQLVAPKAGLYTFHLEGAAGDQVDLTIKGQRARNEKLSGAASEVSLPLTLAAGQLALYQIDYLHREGSGRLRLSWEGPDLPKSLVPASAFRDAWGRFLTNEGRPSDWWLTLTGRWAERLKQAGKSRPVISPVAFPAQEGLTAAPEKPFRQELCLNGRWQFQPVPVPGDYKRNTGQPPDLALPDPGKWEATPIKIPSPWNVNTWGNGRRGGADPKKQYAADSVYYPSYPPSWDGQEMGWLRRTLRVPADWAGRRLVLHFEAVAGEAQVLVNGKPAGTYFDSFLPFEFDVTDLLRRDGDNELLVGVRKNTLFNIVSADYPENQRRTYPNGSNMDELVGIWNDVFLFGVPPARVEDVFVQTWVDRDELRAEVTLRNDGAQPRQVRVSGAVSPWVNLAGKEVADAPVPKWRLDAPVLQLPAQGATLAPGETAVVTLRAPTGGKLKLWQPVAPNLYGLVLTVNGADGAALDRKYVRFGWRQFQIKGRDLLLNGQPLKLWGDFAHPFGPFVLSRRHVWADYRFIKDMGGNMVRPHANPMPGLWLDLADEMGICVLDESAIFGSSIALNLKEPVTWERLGRHVDGLVRRDRSHPSVFGWSPGNEMFALFFHTEAAEKAREQTLLKALAWRPRTLDTTRDWISVDGDQDLDGALPVWSRHMGIGLPTDLPDIDKPRMIGEHGGTYYAAPPLLREFNGDRAFESYEGRNEALAIDLYRMVTKVAQPELAAFSASEISWFGLKQLPFGYDTSQRTPSVGDGVLFPDYTEGIPGAQIERLPPYVATFNPGYDPTLPLYQPLPLFGAMQAAIQPRGGPHPGFWNQPKPTPSPAHPPATNVIDAVAFAGSHAGQLYRALHALGVPLPKSETIEAASVLVVDGETLGPTDVAATRAAAAQVWAKGGLVWLMFRERGAALANVKDLLPAPVEITSRQATSLSREVAHPAIDGFSLNDLYFAADPLDPHIQKAGLGGPLSFAGKLLLTASRVDWSLFERQPEAAKCGALLLDEHMQKSAGAALLEVPCGAGKLWVSTLDPTLGSPAAETFWSQLWRNIGVKVVKPPLNWFVAPGRDAKTVWRYVAADPGPDWEKPGFGDAAWSEGPAGFGTVVPEGKPNTPWTSADIYLRREFDLKELPHSLGVLLHHDEDVDVYLNGARVFAETGHISAYKNVTLDDAALAALRVGRNVIAVHCHQTVGGQFIDVGLGEGGLATGTRGGDHDLLLDGPTQ